MSNYLNLNLSTIQICDCEGQRTHNFEKAVHVFSDESVEYLPIFCPDNDLSKTELFQMYRPLLQTFEANENWTMFTCYSGMIAEISSGLYMYSFGDIDEIGESNFYVKEDLNVILDKLLSEWGELAPPWRSLFRSVSESGYPKNYEPGTMVDHKVLFPNLDEPNLKVGLYFESENLEFLKALRGLYE